MSPALAKLLMCVCAGGTGATIVPAAKALHHRISPRHAVVQQAVAQAAPCDPTFTAGPPIGLPDVGFSASGEGVPAIGIEAAVSTPGAFSRGNPIIGFGGGGGVGGFIGGGGGGGGTNPGGGATTPAPPVSSNAPEPAAWAMMITGFGLLGGTLRAVRSWKTVAL